MKEGGREGRREGGREGRREGEREGGRERGKEGGRERRKEGGREGSKEGGRECGREGGVWKDRKRSHGGRKGGGKGTGRLLCLLFDCEYYTLRMCVPCPCRDNIFTPLFSPSVAWLPEQEM